MGDLIGLASSRILLLGLTILLSATAMLSAEAVPGGRGEAACLEAPKLRPMTVPERDLRQVEQISIAFNKAIKDGFCHSLKSFDYEHLKSILNPDARVQSLYPRTVAPLLQEQDGTSAALITPARPKCYRGPDGFIQELEKLTDDWMRIDRCFFKPHRLFATPEEPRRANLELKLSLAGALRGGGLISEETKVVAEAVESADGGWRFTYIKAGEWQQFRSRRPAFRDFTEQAGLPTDWVDVGYEEGGLGRGQRLYGGISVADYDRDGWPDLYVSRAGKNLLLRNDGKGSFEDVTEAVGAGDPGNSQSALWADFDNDGDLDLFVVNAWYVVTEGTGSKRRSMLYRNDGGKLSPMPQKFGPIGPASGVSAADYDNDGLLDLFVSYYTDEDLNPIHHFIEARDGQSNHLFRNLGGLLFEDTTERAGVTGNGGWSYAASWADYDEDGWIDLYVANDFGENTLHRNRGDGTFEEVAAKAGVLDAANGMSADWGDYDNDGHLDLYISNMFSKSGSQFLALYQDLDEEMARKMQFSVEGNSLYRNRGNGVFEETARTLNASRAGWAWGSNFLDYDNNGWLDIHVVNGFWAGPSDEDA